MHICAIMEVSRRGVLCLSGHGTEHLKVHTPLSMVKYPAHARRVSTTGSRVGRVLDSILGDTSMVQSRPYDADGNKQCCRCLEYKLPSEFGKRASARDGLRNQCKLCRKAMPRPSRKGIPSTERDRARAKAYRAANSEKARAYQKSYYPAHAERAKIRARAWDAAHPTEAAQRHLRFRRNNPDKIRNWGRVYRDRRPDVMAAAKARRRVRERQVGGNFTRGEWIVLKARYQHTCLCCGQQEPAIKLTPDHVVPISKGGSNSIDNIQPMCLRCNQRKNVSIFDYRPLWETAKT